MKRDWKKTKAVNKLKKHKARSSNAVLISAWVGNVREVIKEHQLASGRPLYDWAEQKYPRIWGFIDGCKLRVKRSGNFNIQN